MSVDTTLAVLYAQSGLSTNVANAAMVGPQASLAMTRVLAAEQARQEREKVEKSEKTEDSRLHPDRDGRGGSMHTRHRARQRNAAQLEDESQPQLFKSPVIGNLLNVKV